MRFCFLGIVVVTGSIYRVSFSILWQGQQLITTTAQIGTRSRTIIGSLLLLLLLSSNLIMHCAGWPSILC